MVIIGFGVFKKNLKCKIFNLSDFSDLIGLVIYWREKKYKYKS